MANRVWRHLFGRGLAATVDNFGVNGTPPTHPGAAGSPGRAVHRRGLVGQAADPRDRAQPHLRLSSTGAKLSLRQPEGWTPTRSQQRARTGGGTCGDWKSRRCATACCSSRAGLEFERPDGIQVAGTGGKGKNGVVRSLLSIESPYRTVYLPVLRSLVPPLYSTFDFPDPCQISGQREVTTVAPQALFFMNGEFVRPLRRRCGRACLA